MAVSTIFPNTLEQVWIATNNTERKFFGTIDGLKDYLNNRYATSTIAWEEALIEGKPCAALLVCVASTRFDREAPHQAWRRTGWHAWRDR